MGTKTKPGPFDCYGEAASDEPIFTLLARDPDAALVVEIWCSIREARTGPTDRTREARDVAASMRRWRLRNVGVDSAPAEKGASLIPSAFQIALSKLDAETDAAVAAMVAAPSMSDLIVARGRAVGRDGTLTVLMGAMRDTTRAGDYARLWSAAKHRVELRFSQRRAHFEAQP